MVVYIHVEHFEQTEWICVSERMSVFVVGVEKSYIIGIPQQAF